MVSVFHFGRSHEFTMFHLLPFSLDFISIPEINNILTPFLLWFGGTNFSDFLLLVNLNVRKTMDMTNILHLLDSVVFSNNFIAESISRTPLVFFSRKHYPHFLIANPITKKMSISKFLWKHKPF